MAFEINVRRCLTLKGCRMCDHIMVDQDFYDKSFSFLHVCNSTARN